MSTQTSAIMFAKIIGGILLLPVLLLLLVVAFWIWMIVDCFKHEQTGCAKIAWLVFIMFLGVLGAPMYFFIRRVPRCRIMEYDAAWPAYHPWG